MQLALSVDTGFVIISARGGSSYCQWRDGFQVQSPPKAKFLHTWQSVSPAISHVDILNICKKSQSAWCGYTRLWECSPSCPGSAPILAAQFTASYPVVGRCCVNLTSPFYRLTVSVAVHCIV